MIQRFVRWSSRVLAVAALAAALAGGWAGYLRMTGNFHAVEDGRIYRSGQLSGEDISSRIREHSIRSILNLRGENPGKSWYEAEIAASSAAGIAHIDFGLSANEELTDEQTEKLTVLLRDSPKPLLIHCEAGADRSGLAAALYKLDVALRTREEAAKQLSFRYGHFPWLTSHTGAMDRTFERAVAKRRSATAE